MHINLDSADILENLRIGFKFELFSPFKRSELSHMLSHVLGKNVMALESQDTNFPLDNNTFKIEPDFSGGLKMHELVTAPQRYSEAIHTMFKVYNFIEEKCYTTNRCGVHINISVDNTQIKENIRNLNLFKFILGLNESKVYELWPMSYQSKMQKVFKNPISYIYPKNRFLSENVNAMTISNIKDFKIPQTKYHGINFTKLQEGYIEIRYAGGANYQNKRKESLELINMLGAHLISVLENNKTYTDGELLTLKDIISNQRQYVNSVRTYESFVRSYPNIHLTINMNPKEQAIKAQYSNIRESLCDLLEYTELTSGDINYDSDRSRLQVRGATVKSKFVVEKIDFIDCKIESELSECFLMDCNVRGSLIKKSELSTNNTIKYSLLEDCKYDDSCSNTISHTYLKNENVTIINGNLKECVVNKGIISNESSVDIKTELVNVNKDASSHQR